MSSVWRIKSEAFGVASVGWRCGVAGLGPFHVAFPKPDNCLDRLPLRCFATDWFKASEDLEISFSPYSYYLSGFFFIPFFFRFPGPNSFDSVHMVPPGSSVTHQQ